MRNFSPSRLLAPCCLALALLLPPSAARAQLVQKSFSYESATRTWLEHVPASYNGSKAVPLVIALHGAYNNAATFAPESGWTAVADAKGFIVIFPNGGVSFGNANNSFSWHDWVFDGSKPDDIGFLSKLIAKMAADYRIDTTRVYMTGFSDGGDMTSFFAAAHPTLLAGTSPWAGDWSTGDGQPDSNLKPDAPIPVWLWRGALDDSVPGDAPLATQDQEQITFWTKLAHDRSTPKVTTLGTATTSIYSGGQAEVRFTSVSDLSHGIQPNMATRTWTEFFSRFSRVGSTIHDSGSALPAVRVRAAVPRASAASGTRGVFVVSRDGGTVGDLMVGYQVGGTAVGGVDYITLPGTAALPAGTGSAKVKVRPVDATGAGGIKTVRLTLLPGDGYTLEDPATAKVKIVEIR